MGDLNAKPAEKKKMLSPTAGFALESPMPLVSRGGGRSRPEKRKCYVPPLASGNLILDFPLVFATKKQNQRFKNLKFQICLAPVKDLLHIKKILEQNTTPSQCDRADFKKNM